MNEQISTLKGFIRLVMTTFSCAILGMSAFGWILGDAAEETSAMFILGGQGLSFQTIFQLLLFSIINSAISVVVTNASVFKKQMLLWRMVAVMFSCLVANIIMVVSFSWIRRDSLEAWLWFIISFVIIFVTVAAFAIVKTLIEDRYYNHLLSDYKKRQADSILKKEQGND